MRWTHKLLHRVRSLFQKHSVERELDDELQSHLERQAAHYVAAGMSPDEARRTAIREFGGVELVKEQCRDERRVRVLETLAADLRYALRSLKNSPGFTFFAVVVLGLGIAASTAIFSVTDAVLLRPLPYRDADRLVMVWEDASTFGFPRGTPSPGNFTEWKKRNEVFEDMAAISSVSGPFNLMGEGAPEELRGKKITANLLSVLGAKPLLGRHFTAEDDGPGAAPTVILSYGLWLRRFAGDRGILGKEIWLNGQKHTVVAVMGSDFQFRDREDELWVPVQFTKEQLAAHGNHFLEVVGRLKRGTSLKQANANMKNIAEELGKEFPEDNAKIGAFASSLRAEITGDTRPAILLLLGAVSFLLLIACANVANLLLARASGRQREMAMRLTLGASRWRIVQQALTESVLLATIAGTVGVALSMGGIQLLASLIPEGISARSGGSINHSVLLFALLASLATGLLFGGIPAMGASKVDLIGALKQAEGRSGAGISARRLRDALVVCEVTLAVVLLIGAALMIRSFEKLYHQDKGFLTEQVLVLRTPLPKPKYAEFARCAAFYRDVLQRVQSLSGVLATGYTTWVPLTNSGGASGIEIQGHPQPAPGQVPIPNVRFVSPGYFRTVRMKLIAGRLLSEQDGTDTQPVVVINQTAAQKFWPGENPIGTQLRHMDSQNPMPWITVVGIVGDVRQVALDAPARPEIYFPYTQQEKFAPGAFNPEYLTVRSANDPASLAKAVRGQIWAVDREQPVAGVMPLENLVEENLAPRRTQTSLLGAFAAIALILAALGIYAVLSFVVAQRTREIGVRVALGAKSSDVMRTVLSQGLKLFAIGAALGLLAAFALSRVLQNSLYGVSPSDPLSFGGVLLLLAGVTALACYVPARRAMQVDPMVALRYE